MDMYIGVLIDRLPVYFYISRAEKKKKKKKGEDQFIAYQKVDIQYQVMLFPIKILKRQIIQLSKY